MKNKFIFLTKMSLKRKMKTKWFAIANIILAIIIIGVCNIDSIIKFFGGDFDNKKTVYVVDNASAYDLFSHNMDIVLEQYNLKDAYEVILSNETKDDIVAKLSDEYKNAIILVFDLSENIIDVEMISNDYADTVTSSLISASVNGVKTSLAIAKYNINQEQYAGLFGNVEIKRTILDETKNSTEENMGAIMSTVFPVVILPFFMLVIFLVQMIGAEVNDEKTTRGMEIIISNVSPSTHFFSKCAAGNIFIICQSLLLFLYVFVGMFIRGIAHDSSIMNTVSDLLGQASGMMPTSFLSSLKYIVPLVLVLMLLNFIAYSLLAGILASMTTNAEDFQQMQTPIVMFNLLGYYLAIMAGMFKGSLFIKILGYIPFISAILSPSLLVMGDFTIIDVCISMVLTVVVIYLLIKYGLKVYKVGILNYSTGNLWHKIVAALKKV